jgi:hypothetical protein
MMSIPVATFILICGIGLIIFLRKQEERRHQGVARRLGLKVKAGWFGDKKIVGVHRGVSLRVVETSRSMGDGIYYHYTVIKASVATPLPTGLVLVSPGLLEQIGVLFGMQDFVCGHRRLDDLAVIKTIDVEQTRAYLARPGVADALADFFAYYGDAKVSDKEITVDFRGKLGPPTEYAANRIADLAEILRGTLKYEDAGGALVDANPMNDAKLAGMGFDDPAKFVEAELARRSAKGQSPPSEFDRRAPGADEPEGSGAEEARAAAMDDGDAW